MWDVPLQLPPMSTARTWNHQEPSGRTEDRLVVVSSASLAVSGCVPELADFAVPGSVSACWDHAYEKPSTPLDTSP
jgi:hypothetical protein